jgi:hypothetical protein
MIITPNTRRPHLRRQRLGAVSVPLLIIAFLAAPPAHADNSRLNGSVVSNVYTVQRRAGCTDDLRVNPQLQLAAEWHTNDVLTNRALDGDIGSDGSTPQSRANATGYRGQVAETVAINPALAISGVELINQWYYNPVYFAIMADCGHTEIGVWSTNSLDRTVVVAVYGKPEVPIETAGAGNVPTLPGPDYDASDEIEYGIDWFPWILRGVYPPPAYPPQ